MQKNNLAVEELSIDDVQLLPVSKYDEMSLWLEHVALSEEIKKKTKYYNRLSAKNADIESLSKTMAVISVLAERLKSIHAEMDKRVEDFKKNKLN